jgi:F-type H+-transporting ATPase subunit c
MEPEVIKILAPAATIVFGTVMPALAISMIASKGLDAIGRNPEAADKIQPNLILSVAFVEAIAIYVLVISLIIKFV